MSRHISTDDLARYVEGDLKPRRAAKVASHLAGCAGCSDQISELQQVPELLASVQFPPIPDHLSARIEMAIASESAARVASQPASEAGRRDLPARAKPSGHGWRLPRMSPRLGLQLAAGAAALVVVVGGGYEAVTHLGQSSAPSNTSGTAAGPKEIGPNLSPAQLKYGPEVQYRHANHTDSIQAVQSSTNYVPATFETDVKNAVSSQEVHNKSLGAEAPAFSGSSTSKPAPTTSVPNGSASSSSNFVIRDIQRFRGCVDSIAAGRSVFLVELAMFKGSAAAIIVVGESASGPAEGYAVGDNCSATNHEILFSRALPHI